MPQLPANFRAEDYNVLLVVAEATRIDRTSLQDPEANRTPFLKRLAEEHEAFSFQNASSPSSGTFQSMSSLLGMTHPVSAPYCLRTRSWSGVLTPRASWVPSLFQSRGAHTVWFGYDGNGGTFTRHIRGLETGFEEQVLYAKAGRERTYEKEVDPNTVAAASRFFAGVTKHGSREPFFAFVFLASPHDDYVAHFDGRPARTKRDRYDQELSFMDLQLERLITELKNHDLRERTIVIFTSDHGEEFGDHGGQQHRSNVHFEQTRVPLVVSIPGVPGGAVHQPVSTSYLFPWLLSTPRSSFVPEVTRALDSDLGPLLVATGGAVTIEQVGLDGNYVALLWDDYRLIHDMDSGFTRLYNVVTDPREQEDLWTRRQDLRSRFQPTLEKYLALRRHNRRFSYCKGR
jgi:arylsulfatase A-like enzyme